MARDRKSPAKVEHLLRVEAPHFVAGAIWLRDPWRCIDAAPILKWMVGKPAPDVARYLQKKRWPYNWTPLAENDA